MSSAPSIELVQAGSPARLKRALSPRRRASAWLLAAVLLPTTVAVAERAPLGTSLTSALLVLLLETVIISAIGGFVVAVVAAVAAVLLTNWFLVPPYRTLVVQSTDDIVALVVFVAVAVAASALVESVARARTQATAAGAEADALRDSVDTPADEADPVEVLDRIRSTFGMTRAELLDREGIRVATSGSSSTGPPAVVIDLPERARVIAYGPTAIGRDRRVLTALATAALRAHESRLLALEAARADELAAADRAKSALLAGVGHDLRTPISAIKVAADALAQPDIEWDESQRQELLDGIIVSADRLDELVSNLLDMSRIEAGALTVNLVPAALDGVAASALLGLATDQIDVELPDDLPLAMCDPVILERVMANLLSNALRFAPSGSRITISGEADDERVRLVVADHGPGVAPEDRPQLFEPFQRLSDRSPGGTGVGLAVAYAFTSTMKGTLTPSTTPGGGLTMTVELPRTEAYVDVERTTS